jgi:hypothetical protein
MGDKLEEFLSNIDSSDSMSILFYLPKDISVPISRKLYPGSWGSILSGKGVSPLNNSEKIKTYFNKSVEIIAEFDKSSLDIYKNRRDLLDYLRTCEASEEEDIYKVSGTNTALYNVRPPFFKFFELDNKKMRSILELFDLQKWSVMIFNIKREHRQKINTILSEKEMYLLGVYLKQLDTSPPDLNLRGHLRENVGRVIASLDKKKVLINENNPNSDVQRVA